MPTRRSPPTPVASNGHNGEITSSPSRDGTPKPNKRSVLESGRLCLLRRKGRSCWLGLVVVAAVWICTSALLQEMLDERDLNYATAPTVRLKMSHDAVDTDKSSGGHDREHRILAQPLLGPIITNNKNRKPILLPSAADYRPKPLMVGVLLIPNQESMEVNYNAHHRHHNSLTKLGQLLAASPPAPPPPEEFQLVRIDHQHHRQFQYLNRLDQPHEELVTWKFQVVSVSELGNGKKKRMEIQDGSKEYNRYQPDPTSEKCEPQYDWQLQSFPNCNELHQIDIIARLRALNLADEPESVLIARGGYRDVWAIEQNDLPPAEAGEIIAMKTLLYEHPWSVRNMDRHRRDAVATDRLRRSPHALDLFGYCGNTGLYEYAAGGSLEDAVDDEERWKKWTPKTKMTYAYQVAQAIADVHNIDKEGLPSMSHTDISMSQFVSTDEGVTYKINDFNRARFIFRLKDDPNTLCRFDVTSNKGKFRAPEEYAYHPETAAIDVYSMGNIFFVLLTGGYPFPDATKREAMDLVREGKRPVIADKYLQSTDPLEHALLEAIEKCWVQNPEMRATSREIEKFLRPFSTSS